MQNLSSKQKLWSGLQVIIGGQVVAFGIATYNGNEAWYSKLLMPLVQCFGAETAHAIGVQAAKYKLIPKNRFDDPEVLKSNVWGKEFSNPIGLAAGFDKHAECVDGMHKMGFGFVEVGSVTPEPQEGNAKPRVFRLNKDGAIINRYGFNSHGHHIVFERLNARFQTKPVLEAPDDRNMLNENFWSPWLPRVSVCYQADQVIVGVNLGKNKTSENAVGDYVTGVKTFGPLADYLVINVSSPNTPGLRAMQGRKQLQELVDKVLEERDNLKRIDKPPLLVKIAPDLTEEDKIDIAAVVARPGGGVDGLIVSNTTVSRPDTLTSKHRDETGGLSGEPLKHLATQTVSDMYRLTQGRLPIIGVGGISSAQDVLDKVKAGASLVQLYTALAYHGPPLITRIKRDLVQLLEQEGYASITEAVGADFKDDEQTQVIDAIS